MVGQQQAKIEVKGITKRFGKVNAVSDVSFDVMNGNVVGLLGPSGCGKTTILRCIAGLEDVDEGEIYLDGQPVSSRKKGIFVPPEKRRLGFVFQSYALWPHMTVQQNMSYCIKGLSGNDKKKRIENSLELVGLSDVAARYPSQLSGGQQQRVALARSLCYEPSVILLDEPLSNLDLKERERVRGDLRSLLQRIGITSVFVTHDQEEAFVISDRVVLLNRGSIIQEGSPTDLYSRPANLFVAQFIGRANVLKAVVKEASLGDHEAKVMLPELGAEVTCAFDLSVPDNLSLVAIRFNEISIENKPFPKSTNVVEGLVTSREYRGSVTDYRVQVGSVTLTVTTHPFCSDGEEPAKGMKAYLYLPPAAIKPLGS
jgi:iron(III) transport system ATP-binding protein